MSKHTKGEWKTDGLNVRSESGEMVANCGCRQSNVHCYLEENQANARLIASAPELLEACKQAKSCFVQLKAESLGEPHITNSTIIEYLDKAIAKAEGGTE